MWRKNINVTSPDYEEKVWHCSKDVGHSGWHHQIHSEYFQIQALVSLIKSISNFVYTTTNPQNNL